MWLRTVALAALASWLSACSSTGYHTAKAPEEPSEAIALSLKDKSEIPGRVKIGTPYKVNGAWYKPEYDGDYDQIGVASWYGPDFHGKRTASGEVYNQYAFTAAHTTLPLPSLARVTNLENGKQIIVRINDRGPFARGRIIDLSEGAAKTLNLIGNGTAKVRVQFLEKETQEMWVALNLEAPRIPARVREVQVAAAKAEPPSVQLAKMEADDHAPGENAFDGDLPRPLTGGGYEGSVAVEDAPAQHKSVEDAPAGGEVHYVSADQDLREVAASTPRHGGPMAYIQAAAFSSRENAEKAAYMLARLGKAALHPVAVNGATLYRVRLGPMSARDNLEHVRGQLVDLGFKDAKIIW